jgi:hypothetical protein
LGGEVRLAGYSLASRLAAPGDKIDLTVYWQGVRRADGERVVFVQLQDKGGKLWAAWEGPPVAAWDVGEVVRDHYRVLVPADAPDGELRLIIGVYRAGDKQRLAASGGLLEPRRDYADLGLIRVAGRDHVFTAPPMQQRIGARLGNGAVLLGYDLAPASRPLQLRPSDNLRLALYWQGAGMMDVSYTVFVQLLGPGDRLGGQHDAVPGDGLLPTTSWVKDEVLTDLHSLAVRPDAPPGEYRLVAGLYNAADGVRLPVVVDGVRQPGDMIVLATATVK